MGPRTRNFKGKQNSRDIQAGSGRHGGIGDRNKTGELGVVIEFNADTFASTVRTGSGGILTGVPCLRATPGEVSPLPIGTEVVVSHDLGFPIILGCLSLPSTNDTDTATHSVTDVGGFGGQGLNKATLPEGNFRRPGEPTDLIPGDWAKVGPEGNTVAILGGGTTILKSGPLAQIRTHLINDLVEVISRNYRHITDMGEFNITNNNGRINMSFRGATDQRNEAGPDEEHWTIRMDMGSEGDMFNLEFTNTKGQTLFKFHVDASGHCEIFGVNGVSIGSDKRYKGQHEEEHGGDSSKTVGGSQTTTVAGTETRSYGNTVKENIGGNYECSITNDWRTMAMRDVSIGAGRSAFLNVLGNPIPNPLTPAAVFDIKNGNWEVTLGSPLSIPMTSGFSMTANNSNISHTVMGLGDITNTTRTGRIIDTSLAHFIDTMSIPNSIVLGGSVPAGENIVKWQSLVAYLKALHSQLDNHFHVMAAGTSTAGPFPVTGITGTPFMPFSWLEFYFQLFKSLVVKVSL